MAIRTTVSSGIDVSNVGDMSLGVASHENAGATAASAPVLLSVAADQIIPAGDFAKLVAAGTSDLTAAFVTRVLNALGETVADIVDTATAAPNIDFGWGRFLFEIAGSVATATGTPGVENTCRFSGTVNPAIQRAFATKSAYVDTTANPCDLKRIRDKTTSALNTVSGTSKFYAEGRGFTWGTANDRQELYKPDGTKVCNLTLDTADSYGSSLTLQIPTTATAPVGDYVVRIECAILGKVYRMEKRVSLVQAVTPPAAPTITKIVQEDQEGDDIVTLSSTSACEVIGTNFDYKTGDTATIELYQDGVKVAGGTATVENTTATKIFIGGFQTDGTVESNEWINADTKFVLTTGGHVIRHALTFV